MARILLRPIRDTRYGTLGGWDGLLPNPVPNALGRGDDRTGYWFHEDGGVFCDIPKLTASELGGQQVLAIRVAHREEQGGAFGLDNGWVMTDLVFGSDVYRPARVYTQDGFRGPRTKRGPSVYRGRNEAWSIEDVNSMRLQVGAARGDDWGPDKSKRWCRATQAWLEVITPAPLTRPTLANLNVSNVNPRMTTQVTGIEPEQMVAAVFQVALDSNFERNVREYTTPINEEDSTSVTLDYKGTPGTDSHANLAPGVWYYRAKTFDMLGNESQWSITRTITISLSGADLPVPTLTAPGSGTHRDPLMERSARFTLGTNNAGVPNWTPGERLLGVEWRFATDSGFNNNVVQWANYQGTFGGNTSLEVSYNPTPRSSREAFLHGPAVSVHDADQTLRPQGTWYAQVRAVDSFGNSSNWSTASSFVVDHKPHATNLIPSGGDFDPRVSSFRWTFSDPWARDSQTAYQLTIHRGPVTLYDTGKVFSTANGASVDFDLGDTPTELTYRVRLWDTDDAESSSVASSTFRYRKAPIVSVVSPLGEITTGQPEIEWTTQFSDGHTAVQYRVIITNIGTGEVEYDSKSVASSATSHTVDSSMLSNMSDFEVRVYVFDSGELTGWGLSLFRTNFIVPQSLDTVASSENYESGGYVDVWWSGEADAFFQEYRIYHRKYSGDLTPNEGWRLSGVVTNAGQRHFRDYTPAGSSEFEFSVVQVANRFGSRVEGQKRSTLSARAIVFSVDYWLIVPDNEESSVRLLSVVADSFTDQVETSKYNIVGGGTRVNKGARIGMEGSLACQVRASTQRGAKEQVDMLRELGDQDRYLLMRDPFGNITKVSLGDISVERIGGVGNFEFADLEIPYTEVM